jgi:hypothetical protein
VISEWPGVAVEERTCRDVQAEWDPEELTEARTLRPGDWSLVGNKAGATRLGFVAMLKFYEMEGRFPAYAEERV